MSIASLFLLADPVGVVPMTMPALAPALALGLAVPGLSPRIVADRIRLDVDNIVRKAQEFDAPKTLALLTDRLFPEAPPPPPGCPHGPGENRFLAGANAGQIRGSLAWVKPQTSHNSKLSLIMRNTKHS